MSDPATQHRSQAPATIRCSVITISDTRTRQSDTGGDLICELLADAGHSVERRLLLPDEPQPIRTALLEEAASGSVDALLLTGGTGVSPRDQTPETVQGLLTKSLPGYGELFRMLSFEEIGAAAMMSRAAAGLIGQTVLFTMPGSPAAIRLAMTRLILPELGHFVAEARKA